MLVFGSLIYPATAGYADSLNQERPAYKDQFVVAQPVQPEPAVPKWTYCSCVEFAKWYLGKQGEAWGNARDIKPTKQAPYVGGLVITSEGPGHIAVVKQIRGNQILVVEANYERCQRTERTIDINDSKIIGFK